MSPAAFKNLSVYAYQGELSIEHIEQIARQAPFEPCTKYEQEKIGFVSPWGEDSDYMVHVVNGCVRLVFRREERKVSDKTVNAELSRRLKEMVNRGDVDRITPAIRREVRDRVKTDLATEALPVQSDTSVYVDTARQWIVIDDTSANRCDRVVTIFRMAAEIIARPLLPQKDPARVMGDWIITEKTPANLQYGHKCEIYHGERGTIKYDCEFEDHPSLYDYLRNQDFMVTSMQLRHLEPCVSFRMNAVFAFQQVKIDQAELIEPLQGVEDANERLDILFDQMIKAHRTLLDYLLDLMGGQVKFEDEEAV